MVKQLTGGIGADYVVECAGSEATINQAIHMTNRGGKICLAAFPHDPVTMDIAHLVKNNIYAYGIQRRRPQRHPPRDGADGGEAFRRHQNPHAHVSAG